MHKSKKHGTMGHINVDVTSCFSNVTIIYTTSPVHSGIANGSSGKRTCISMPQSPK